MGCYDFRTTTNQPEMPSRPRSLKLDREWPTYMLSRDVQSVLQRSDCRCVSARLLWQLGSGNDQQQFLASADYLTSFGLPTLISSFEAATSEVLKGKQLKDFFNTIVLHDTVIQILNTFMSTGSPHQWLGFLMPEDSKRNDFSVSSSTGSADLSNASKFEQLMLETRAALSSTEFGNIVDILLKAAVDVLMEDVRVLCGDANLTSGIPLAKLLSRIARMDQILLEEPNRNRYIQVIQDIPEVEIFFTLLYASIPAS
ncbi:hypothetical protein HAX54_040831 [Datura stramonium]|uniref:Uncharacterized protein n=1 Tax=Datura stramonium TaxID=4076 RepID=A0ABS8VRG4_DATST|nr:hypothetical protein [Datura stramonium]